MQAPDPTISFPAPGIQPRQPVPGVIYKDTHYWWAAVLLSLCVCAPMGQFYNGQYIKGLVMVVVGMIFVVLTGGFGAIIYWPAVLIDAGLIGWKLEQGKGVREWEWF